MIVVFEYDGIPQMIKKHINQNFHNENEIM